MRLDPCLCEVCHILAQLDPRARLLLANEAQAISEIAKEDQAVQLRKLRSFILHPELVTRMVGS